MAAYDPKRTRPVRDDDVEVGAPVDALLSPTATQEPDTVEPSDAVVDLRTPDVPSVAPAADDVPAPVLNVPPPTGGTARIAVVAGVAAATVAAILLVRRMRRRR